MSEYQVHLPTWLCHDRCDCSTGITDITDIDITDIDTDIDIADIDITDITGEEIQ
jgi:hypothetical protein